jgi:hypothetical protein
MNEKKDIVYCNLLVAYKKDKKITDKQVWCLCSSPDPGDIVADDHSRSIIERQCYPSTYKGERKIIVKKVINHKFLWKKNMSS